LLLSEKRRPVVLAACLLGLVAVAFGSYRMIFSNWSAASGDKSSIAEQRGKVAALGRIEPQSEIINLGAGSAADRLATLFVARGDQVKKDQIIGHLGGYDEQMAQHELYRAQLYEAKLRLETEIALNRARIEAAEVRQKEILEVSPHRIAAQEATIAGLEAKLANDKDILDSHLQLLTRGTATRRQADDQKTLVLQDEANLKSARARLSELKRKFDVDQMDAAVQIQLARATLDRMQVEFPIRSLERQIALAETRAKRLTLYAPIDGRILNLRVKPGEDIGSGPILTLGNTERMHAVAEVYETDIAQVRVGQPAIVSSRALSKPISGKVIRIGNMVFKNDVLNVDPAARADARVVEVWIDLDDTVLAERLTNLTVDVVITTSGADAQRLARPHDEP
jgi:HlyD family secretion protein